MYDNVGERSQPEKWEKKARETTTKIEKDENIQFIMNYELIGKEDTNKVNMSFIVTVKQGKATGKYVIKHIGGHNGKECPGHANIFAEYDKNDAKILAEETEDHGIKLALKMMADDNCPFEPDQNKAIIIYRPDTSETPQEVLNSLKASEQTTAETERMKKLLKSIGIEEELNMTMQIAPTPTITIEELTKKIDQEQELIKKYGKKAMEVLAKNMNYKGIKLNTK